MKVFIHILKYKNLEHIIIILKDLRKCSRIGFFHAFFVNK